MIMFFILKKNAKKITINSRTPDAWSESCDQYHKMFIKPLEFLYVLGFFNTIVSNKTNVGSFWGGRGEIERNMITVCCKCIFVATLHFQMVEI